jgi:acyl carrier protein
MASVSIQDIEAALAAFPGLAAVAVAEQGEPPAGPCLVAYVAPGGVDMPALHAHVRKFLPGHLVPAAIVTLDAIPVTADGTADLQALPTPDLGAIMPYRAPDTAQQEALCMIFAEVLRVPRFGVNDDFFSLGGRSVDAVVLAGRISAALGVRMSITDLFEAPTVAELDQRLDGTAD